MKIKGWELMKKIADGEIKENQKIKMIFNDGSEENFIFDGIDIINSIHKNIFDIYEIREIIKQNFQLIQDEIDIDSIEEIKTVTNNISGLVKIINKINELVQAVKQLNKKLEEK